MILRIEIPDETFFKEAEKTLAEWKKGGTLALIGATSITIEGGAKRPPVEVLMLGQRRLHEKHDGHLERCYISPNSTLPEPKVRQLWDKDTSQPLEDGQAYALIRFCYGQSNIRVKLAELRQHLLGIRGFVRMGTMTELVNIHVTGVYRRANNFIGQTQPDGEWIELHLNNPKTLFPLEETKLVFMKAGGHSPWFVAVVNPSDVYGQSSGS